MTQINNSVMAARNAILARNEAFQQVTKNDPAIATQAPGNVDNQHGFAGKLKEAISDVNALQQASSAAATQYEMGESNDIAAVMMAKQKASIGFEATMQVRNKLLSAYQDIMNMPV